MLLARKSWSKAQTSRQDQRVQAPINAGRQHTSEMLACCLKLKTSWHPARTMLPSTRASFLVPPMCLHPGPSALFSHSRFLNPNVAWHACGFQLSISLDSFQPRQRMGKPFCPEGGRFMLEARALLKSYQSGFLFIYAGARGSQASELFRCGSKDFRCQPTTWFV